MRARCWAASQKGRKCWATARKVGGKAGGKKAAGAAGRAAGRRAGRPAGRRAARRKGAGGRKGGGGQESRKAAGRPAAAGKEGGWEGGREGGRKTEEVFRLEEDGRRRSSAIPIPKASSVFRRPPSGSPEDVFRRPSSGREGGNRKPSVFRTKVRKTEAFAESGTQTGPEELTAEQPEHRQGPRGSKPACQSAGKSSQQGQQAKQAQQAKPVQQAKQGLARPAKQDHASPGRPRKRG